MTEDRSEIRHINWGELLSFTHIFKSFKLAIHPSKLALAAAAIILVWAAGQALDLAWAWTGNNVQPGDVQMYVNKPDTYDAWVKQWDESSRKDKARLKLQEVQGRGSDLDDILLRAGSVPSKSPFQDLFNDKAKPNLGRLPVPDKNPPESLRGLVSRIRSGQSARDCVAYTAIQDARKAQQEKVTSISDKKERKAAQDQLDADYMAAMSNLTSWRVQNRQELKQLEGVGVFDSFIAFEWSCMSNAASAVVNGNITGGWLNYQLPASADTMDSYTGGAVAPKPGQIIPGSLTPGFMYFVMQGIGGFKWLLTQHTLLAAIWLLVTLAVWALLGGAIHRIAALHATRDEKISIVQALKFSLSKWPSFFTAPLIPLGVIFFLAGLLALGSLALSNWPVVGAPLTGILIFLAIGMGLAMAFIVVGFFSGSGLLYPTIAVEGSDSFDAFSRSFAYVYARPWHMGLYALVALVYGTICYLFVRFFAYLALISAHTFMRWGCFTDGQSLREGDKIPVIWQTPTWDSLSGINWDAMSTSEAIGGTFIWLWVALVAAVVGGFILSFASSSGTIIYCLLRRKVDATDMDDVYVRETVEGAPADAPAPEAAPAAPPAQTQPTTTVENPTPTNP